MKTLIVIILLILSNKINACSFVQMIEEFKVNNAVKTKTIPTKPYFKFISIKRGSDDGNGGSCSDAGILSLEQINKPKLSTGYIFEIIEGIYKDKIFYSNPIVATQGFKEKGLYNFVWLDKSRIKEPLEFKVKITAVSESGDKSEPQILQISQSEIK